MIAPMSKVFIAARAGERDRLLDALRDLGVLHLTPIDPAAAAPEHLREALAKVRRAQQVVASVEPAGDAPDLAATEAADEILRIARRADENDARLSALHREADRLERWGDLRLEQLTALADAGVKLSFYSVPAKRLGEIEAECVHRVAGLPGKRVLAAVATRAGEPDVPEDAELVEPPPRDRPTILAEAKEVDAALAADARRLAELAHLAGALEAKRRELAGENELAAALAGGHVGGDLFAVEGWAPTARTATLADELLARDVHAGVTAREADEGEQAPTLITYPAWVRPIKGLFDMLGTLPGYEETDVSGFFMVALPIFAAMLIGDAGYGLLFLLVPALMYRKATAAVGKPGIHLIMIVGVATIIWGVLTGVYFGVSPGSMGALGRVLAAGQVIHGEPKEQAFAIMKVSFVMAAIHLCVAQLRQALALAPRLAALGKIGWAVFLWGIFFVIWYLFFNSQAGEPMHWMTGWLLAGGAGLAICFTSPSRNVPKTIGLGLAQFPLAALSAFSDSISYIRLMGVGLASTIIGQTFNSLGADVAASGATWLVGGLVALFGHALNIAMCMIAVLAHGVRLNMLEFSNNAGVQWAGYAYRPFGTANRKEQ